MVLTIFVVEHNVHNCVLKYLDKWEWAIILSRYLVGSGICFLALLDIGSSKPIFDSQSNQTDSVIWVVARGQGNML